jgi:serine phosphatase RsbU (regulator of sigma subunit)/predicted ester cyclase
LSAEENLTLVRRFFEAQAEGDLDAIGEMMAPDFVDRSLLPSEEPGREGYKRSVAEDHDAFSDLRYIIEDQVAEGDKVVTRLTAQRIHDREFLGFAPSGGKFESTGIIIHRIAEGRIAEEWSEGSSILDLTQRRLEQAVLRHERIEQELWVARRIQRGLLPKVTPALDGWQLVPHYQPAREVGGDFYDFLQLEDGRLGLVIGDVSGKGVPAAVLMASTRSILRAVAQRSSPPGHVLEEVNEILVSDVPPNTFITCFYGVLEPESGHLSYANAGHNPPCYRRHDGSATELRARGMPLGLMSGMHYDQEATTLMPGDGILFYSDGLVEARDPQGVMFGLPRLKSLVAKHLLGGSGLTAILSEELKEFTGEWSEQEDDITFVTLRYSPER